MFGWHKEDVDLNSINYCHMGKPKFWYALPVSEGPKLEKFTRERFPDAFAKCPDYLRHKTLMISPYVLKKHIPDLKIHKMVHQPGEFVITFGGAYHSGFNWGFNIAEAINFATSRWLDVMPKATRCECVGDSVRIDKRQFVENLKESDYRDYPEFARRVEYLEECLEEADSVSTAPRSGKKSKDPSTAKKSKKGKKKQSLAELGTASSEKSMRLTSRSTVQDKDLRRKTRSSREKIEQTAVDDVEVMPGIQKKSIEKTRRRRGLRFTMKKATKKTTPDLIIENWVACDQCSKWRRIDSNFDVKKLKKTFHCDQIQGTTCKTPEENWKQKVSSGLMQDHLE
eukprot:TRINITY_DN2558_c0_g1_i2.p1 TRINITY_DN2558_c0_g1~~TRINITY_DN2558_c0_g1_i2.p1  ORF type:complete len:340 (-),score=53.17 TRINITY_DN2558_c0_g1_i2:109-1128(-)